MALVETPEFTEGAEKSLSEGQCYELLTHIAWNPECGDVMPGTGGVRKLRWALPGKGKRGEARSHPGGEKRIKETDACSRQHLPTQSKGEDVKHAAKAKTPGQSIIAGVKQAIAWAAGEDIPVKKTIVKVPHVDVREVRTRMRLSQDQFAQRFGFAPASVRNWEQGRRQPEGPARVLLAVIARHPKAVESVLGSRTSHRASPLNRAGKA